MDTVTRDAETPTFEEWASIGWPALYRYAYLLVGAHADAEDLAQQTLLKAFRSWPRVEQAASPVAYMRRILTNTYLSQRRPKRHRLEVLTGTPPATPYVAGSAVEERLLLWPHVKSLPPRQRAVVVLRFYEDLSEQEIAEVLGCSRGTVKSTAHHALTSLRKALATQDGDAQDGTES